MLQRFLLAPCLAIPVVSCGPAPDLVIYCSLDQVHAERILSRFEARSGLRVSAQFDVEANKTVGLVNRLLAEKRQPRCDVYWNNEIAHTIRLKFAGVTEPYFSPSAIEIPAEFRDPEGHWTGFAGRARVILFRRDLEGEHPPPSRIHEFLNPKFSSHGGLAAPLTGTTLTHFVVRSMQLGNQATLDWLEKAQKSGLHFGPGNAAVMRRVCEGDYSWCLTDTDDAAAALRNGYPVEWLFPDQGEGEEGTLLIPNTVCLIRNAPHPDAAQQLIDFLLSEEVEMLLAAGDSQQIPLRPSVPVPKYLKLPGRDFRVQTVDWEAAAKAMAERAEEFQSIFTRT